MISSGVYFCRILSCLQSEILIRKNGVAGMFPFVFKTENKQKQAKYKI